MASGQFEPVESGFLAGAFAAADVFVDVGANIGFFTCLARKHGLHVVAIEPLPQNLDYLYRNLLANGWPDAEVFPVGVGTAPGIIELYGGGTGASLISSWGGASRAWRRRIALSTLDTLLADRFQGKRMIVKVDVEGAELQVLRGAAQTLARTPSPVWLVEVCLTENFPDGTNPDFRAVFETFWLAGYRSRALEADRQLEVTPEVVDRWIRNRARDFGYVNFIFSKPPV